MRILVAMRLEQFSAWVEIGHVYTVSPRYGTVCGCLQEGATRLQELPFSTSFVEGRNVPKQVASFDIAFSKAGIGSQIFTVKNPQVQHFLVCLETW